LQGRKFKVLKTIVFLLFSWASNVVSHIKGRKEIEGVQKQFSEVNFYAWRLEKIA
jgi:hypothetical protein